MSSQNQDNQIVPIVISIEGLSQEGLQQLADDINKEFPGSNAVVRAVVQHDPIPAPGSSSSDSSHINQGVMPTDHD